MPRSAAVAPWESTVRQGAWFASLPRELAERLLDEAELVRLSAGQRLFARGDAPDGLYVVADGVVRITGLAETGQESLLVMLEPPHWFGEVALFDGEPRTHDAWAEGDATLLRVPQAAMRTMLAERAEWWQPLGRLLTQKLRALFVAMEELSLLPPRARLARRLLAMAAGFGLATAAQEPARRVLKVSQEQLGAMLALSRQTVNQALGELEAAGAVHRQRGAIEVVDVEALRRHGGA